LEDTSSGAALLEGGGGGGGVALPDVAILAQEVSVVRLLDCLFALRFSPSQALTSSDAAVIEVSIECAACFSSRAIP
jgi:hypothetical protein